VEKSDALADFDGYGDEDDDDENMVMSIKNANDCIGCEACSKVCPKNCFTHAHKQAA
jgi:formate hydrogenlyase subunit 6/NADH:ubiquinone oxidoreductase subunit I